MPHPNNPDPSPFTAIKSTLDGVTSAPFATYHILTCIGLIATNHILADHREHPRRIRAEEKKKRDEKWRREDEEDARLDRMMKQAKYIPYMTPAAQGITSYRSALEGGKETYRSHPPVYGTTPPPPYPYVLVPPRRTQTYTPNVPPPLHPNDPAFMAFPPPPPPPGPKHQTYNLNSPTNQHPKHHHSPPPPPQQPHLYNTPSIQDPAFHHHHHSSPPPTQPFSYPRYGISKTYAAKLEARARGQWISGAELMAMQRGNAWEKMRDVKIVPVEIMNGRGWEGGRDDRNREGGRGNRDREGGRVREDGKSVRWGRDRVREFERE